MRQVNIELSMQIQNFFSVVGEKIWDNASAPPGYSPDPPPIFNNFFVINSRKQIFANFEIYLVVYQVENLFFDFIQRLLLSLFTVEFSLTLT